MKGNRWTTGDISDQTGSVALITGASSGIGYEAARVLAGKNAQVILAVRSLDKGQAAARKIRGQYSRASLAVMRLDLADLASVRAFAAEVQQRYSRLDRLINNAGVMVPPQSITADGFELQLGTNHMGHFALTGLLLELMSRTPHSRIVNVASSAHRFGNLDFSDLDWTRRRYQPWRAYGDSKIANLYFTYELDRRLKRAASGIIVTAAHPGWTATELQRHTGVTSFLNRFLAQNSMMGALPTLRAACDELAKGGEYFGPDGIAEWRGYPIRVNSNRRSREFEIAAKLWAVSEQRTGVKFDFGALGQSAIA